VAGGRNTRDALVERAYARYTEGDAEQARLLLSELGTLGESSERDDVWLAALVLDGILKREVGDLRAAEHSLRTVVNSSGPIADAVTSRARREILGHKADALNELGMLLEDLGQVDAGRAVLEDALALARRTRGRRLAAIVLSNVGRNNFKGGRIERAIACYREAISVHRELDDPLAEIRTTTNLAMTLNGIGHGREAYALLLRTTQLATKHDARRDLLTATSELVRAASLVGIERSLDARPRQPPPRPYTRPPAPKLEALPPTPVHASPGLSAPTLHLRDSRSYDPSDVLRSAPRFAATLHEAEIGLPPSSIEDLIELVAGLPFERTVSALGRVAVAHAQAGLEPEKHLELTQLVFPPPIAERIERWMMEGQELGYIDTPLAVHQILGLEALLMKHTRHIPIQTPSCAPQLLLAHVWRRRPSSWAWARAKP
jgi:hypothetical protein